YKQGLALCREVGDRILEANILNRMGVLADYQNDLPGAQILYGQALILYRALRDSLSEIVIIGNLANNFHRQGDSATAEEYYRQGLLLSYDQEETRVRTPISSLLVGLAMIALEQGKRERAALLLGVFDTLHEAIGNTLPPIEQARYDQ